VDDCNNIVAVDTLIEKPTKFFYILLVKAGYLGSFKPEI